MQNLVEFSYMRCDLGCVTGNFSPNNCEKIMNDKDHKYTPPGFNKLSDLTERMKPGGNLHLNADKFREMRQSRN